VIGGILAGTAGFLAWECQSLLTGEGAAPEVQASIRAIALCGDNQGDRQRQSG
jgi:hypothetical protein